MPRHISIPRENTIQLLNFTPVNPLISHCEIKVCYVDDKVPNRNGSLITKAVATDMAKTLPGCPIVGFYNENKDDFEQHNKQIEIRADGVRFIETTRPYGFVDLNAKVWFQTFVDDGVEHEYLCTEGYIWTGAYPESKRILTNGNGQSMELDDNSLAGDWSFDDNGYPEFFIINEAVISKLCILGEDCEPCFEGAGIAATFSLDDSFKQNMYAMIGEIKAMLEKGGNTQMDDKQNLNPTPEDEFKKKPEEDEDKEEKKENPFPNNGDKDKKDEEEKKDAPKDDDADKKDEEDEDEKKKKTKHSLSDDEIKETEVYQTLASEYATLTENYNSLQEQVNTLTAEIEPLRQFRAEAERKEKQDLIDSFYMLSDADKASIVEKIDTYSLHDIEAELSIMCVRNKVSFDLDNDKEKKPTSDFSLNLDETGESDNAPAWIKAVRETAKNL